MSYSAAGPERREAGEDRRHNAISVVLTLAVITAFVIRVFVNDEMMNSVWQYTTEYGAFYEKIHLGTYLTLLLVPVVLFNRPFYLEGDDIGRFKDLLRFSLLILLLIAVLILLGPMSAGGLFIDTYLVAGAAGLLMLALARDGRRVIGDTILVFSLLSAMVGIMEFATRSRFLPSQLVELTFRPNGLAGHPLNLGMISAASLAFVALTTWKPWVKVLAMVIFLVGTAASGARFALVLAVLEVLALILFVPWGMERRNERKAKLGVLLLALVGGTGLFAVLAAGGALERFQGGIVDQNFFARTDIYSIFSMVGWQDIVFGADMDAIMKIVNEKLNLPFIESSPVYFTFLLGAPLAAAVFVLLFWLYWRLLRHVPRPAWIGVAVFLIAALSNNTLSSKTPVIALFVILILAYAPRRGATPSARAV
ncbi:VpsF family polysaccharide biosynthesis protein [Devosia sp. CN2-171]|uniref:VpsF family polysaccharide biosynthesis protein n=1 Tax=Devosia sp. CN2-171 TaxID=3400909 RepID=UPI003BF7D170